TMTRTPRREMLHGIDVRHPRFPLVPKVGMSTAPFLLAAASARALREIRDGGHDFEAIDAHYFYPAGVAGTLLRRRLGRPAGITARGGDINLIARHVIPRRLIVWAARRAAAVVTVSQALQGATERLGIDPSRISVLRNGVDARAFRPLDRDAERSRLGVTGRLL